MLKAPESWTNLEEDCQLIHHCAAFQLKYSISRRDRKTQKKIEREQRDIKSVMGAVKKSLEKNPDQTPEELTKSVIALLAPWLLQFLGNWLLSKFQATILNWIINRLTPPS